MNFKDDIDGRLLTISINNYEKQKYIVIEGEGYFNLNEARKIAQTIIACADIIEKETK